MGTKWSTPVPWVEVGEAIMPGLVALVLRSCSVELFGLSVRGGVSFYNSLTAVSALLVIVGLLWKRGMASWMFPAVGVFLSMFPGLVMDLLFPSPGSPPPMFGILANLWPVVAWGVSGVVFWRLRHDISMPKQGWALLGLVVAAGVLQGGTIMVLFMMGSMVLSMAVGLAFARRHRLVAGLVPVAGMYWWVDSVFDPSYFMPSNYATIIEMALGFAFLVVTPIWVLRSRSPGTRRVGLLLPPSLALVGCEVLRSIAYPPGYSMGTWLIRGLGAGQLTLLIACAIVVCQSVGSRAETSPIGGLFGAA